MGRGLWFCCVAGVGATTGCDLVLGLDRPSEAALPACSQDSSGSDEDVDGIANGLDRCPGIADPDQADADGDGVGDACDPHPARPGDPIAFAAYFVNGLDPEWKPDSSTSWLTVDCATTNTISGALLAADLGDAASLPAIEIRTLATEFQSGMSSLRITMQPASGAGVNCHVDYNEGVFGLFLNNSPVRPETIATEHLVRFVADDLGSACSLNGVASNDSSVISRGKTRITIAALGIRTRIEHIIGYAFVPPT